MTFVYGLLTCRAHVLRYLGPQGEFFTAKDTSQPFVQAAADEEEWE